MTSILFALLILPLAQSAGNSEAIQAGKAFWESYDNDCRLCHGVKGEGGRGMVTWAKPLLGTGAPDQVAVAVPRPAQAP